MKIVTYKSTNPWVGRFICPHCYTVTKAWRPSGMRQSFRHFYCNECSNAIMRESDKALVYKNDRSPELLNRIAETLPACPCGGHFMPGTNPKCPSCRAGVGTRREEARPQRQQVAWDRVIDHYEQLRLARLAAYLRRREPDDWIGYSILVFRLTHAEVDAALLGPPVELGARPAIEGVEP